MTMQTAPESRGDHHEADGTCRHLWRVFGYHDRCVHCGDQRTHPDPYPFDPGPPPHSLWRSR